MGLSYLKSLSHILINFKNAFQYTLGADKHCLTPLIRGIWKSQIQSQKVHWQVPGQRVSGVTGGMGTWRLKGTAFQFRKVKNSGDG